MAEHTVLIQVLKTYSVTVNACSGKAAVMNVESMQTVDIEREGSLKNCETDFAELVEQ
jgi:hypothetical protein